MAEMLTFINLTVTLTVVDTIVPMSINVGSNNFYVISEIELEKVVKTGSNHYFFIRRT